jgi:Fic family protein
MARMIARWELVRRGFDPHGIFPVEERYLEDPVAYRAGLEEVAREKGEMTGWLEFAADALRRTLEKVRTRGLRLGVESRGVKTVFNARQEQVFSLLRDRGMLSPVELWAELGVTKQGAAKIVRPLLDAGMIRRIGTRKSGKYLMS